MGEQFPRRAPHAGAGAVAPGEFQRLSRRLLRQARGGRRLAVRARRRGAGAGRPARVRRQRIVSGPLWRLRRGHARAAAVGQTPKGASLRPRQAIEAGVALLTNDRKATGLVLSLSIIANATLAGLPRSLAGGWRRPGPRTRRPPRQATAPMRLRAASLDMRSRRAFRRQPAEGRPGQMAPNPAPAPHAGRTDPRHRRRRQARDLPTGRPMDRRRASPFCSSPRKCPNC